MTRLQQTFLVLLRTAIGWHFLYEGYFKLASPAWSRAGTPLEPFSSAAYLQATSGPFAGVFHALASPAWVHRVDLAVAIALIAAGSMLMLGFLTQLGAALAMALLAVFYMSAIPSTGLPQPHAEGTYLIVNKNLIELIAAGVVMAFRTGRIAGLDLLLRRRAPRTPFAATAPTTTA